MKEDKNTEMPGAPLVPDAKKIAEPKQPKKASKAGEPKEQKPSMPQEETPSDETEDKIAQESSANLEDDQPAEANTKKSKPKGKIRRFFKAWWENKTARWATIIIVALVVIGVAAYPRTRYFLLNAAGVRSGASVTVIDNASRQPLKNVEVQLNNASGTTNEDGYVELEKVRLGATNLTVSRRAFASFEKQVTVGWGSNPLGEVILEPKGLQYTFMVRDFLSEQPLEKVEAISGDASAFSDKEGKIILTLDTTSDEPVEIAIQADGYRTEKITETAETTSNKEINMVPAQEQAFISKRSGKYDLYKIYADGKGEKLILSGTGFERDDMVLVPQPSGSNVAYVSTRDGQRASDGTLLSTLNIVNLGNNKVTKLDTADRIQVVSWVNDTLVYVVVVDEQGPGGAAKKQRLVSYNLELSQKLDITSATYFNDIMVADDKVFYAPASESAAEDKESGGQNTNIGFYMSNVGGTEVNKLLDREVWSMIRSSYGTITLSTGKDWYEFKLGSDRVERIGGAPASQKTRVYVNNAGNSRSLWVDERDGKGVLLSYNLESKKDKTLVNQSGLTYPVRWLNDTTAVYRINTDAETADYVLSLNGGEPRKITDVTSTAGIDKWYYF